MMDERIVFDSITCPNRRALFCSLVEELVRLCPSDSAFHAYCGQRSQHFSVALQVISQTTNLHAAYQGQDFLDTLCGFKRAMLNQIVDWRRQRFVS